MSVYKCIYMSSSRFRISEILLYQVQTYVKHFKEIDLHFKEKLGSRMLSTVLLKMQKPFLMTPM